MIKERILKPADGKYPQVSLSKDGTQKSHIVHTLVVEAFIGTKPAGEGTL